MNISGVRLSDSTMQRGREGGGERQRERERVRERERKPLTSVVDAASTLYPLDFVISASASSLLILPSGERNDDDGLLGMLLRR